MVDPLDPEVERSSAMDEEEDRESNASEEQISELARQWHRFIEQYPKLRLTKPTDRLPALSGLCQRVSHLREDYIAGL
jgi:hypothetical protein